MRTVSLQDLQDQVAEYVGAAQAGETVSITADGKVVAEIVPARSRSILSDEEILEQGVREGWLTRAKVDWREPLPDRGPPPPDEPDVPFDVLMAELAMDREDR